MENLSNWRTRTLAYCGDFEASNFGANSSDSNEVIRAINDAVQDTWSLVVDNDRYYYYATYDITTVTGQQNYALPVDFARPLGVEDRENASADEHGYELADSPPEERYTYVGWNIRGQQFYLNDFPDSGVADKYRLHYVRRIPALTYGTATAGTSTSITLASTATYGSTSNQDDYYNNSRLLIVSGTGAGEIRTISDYVGSTRVATIDSGTTPTTSSVYSILSDLPDEAGRVVCLKAALNLLARVEAPHFLILDRMYRDARRRLVSSIQKRSATMAKRMRIVRW